VTRAKMTSDARTSHIGKPICAGLVSCRKFSGCWI